MKELASTLIPSSSAAFRPNRESLPDRDRMLEELKGLVHQVRGSYSGAVAELAILEGASEGPYLD
jgi:hypothetical protein